VTMDQDAPAAPGGAAAPGAPPPPARPRVGLLVGHHGPGTGASAGGRDEWTLCRGDATALAQQLAAEGLLEPVLLVVEDPAARGTANILRRAAAAVQAGVVAAVEFHLNAAPIPPSGKSPGGDETWVRRAPGPKTQQLGALLVEEFNKRLANPDRGLKEGDWLVLRRLHAAGIPAALLEPEFVGQPRCADPTWRASYVAAVKMALYRYCGVA
jgi:N-acetylmuramoyl-L-alanine amidase